MTIPSSSFAPTYDFSGRIVLVTGASGGLGRAVVHAFLATGARVAAAVHSASPQMLAQVLPTIAEGSGDAEERLSVHQADLLIEDEVASLVREIEGQSGRLDITLNLAGGYAAGEPVTDLTVATWDHMLDLNLRSAFLVSKYAVRVMVRHQWGRIINVSSRAAYSGKRNAAAYAVAKRGVLTLTEAQAEEVREFGVTVNAIVPSIIDTPANRQSMPSARHSLWPAPEQIARVCLFLASDDAALISGAAIPVYGRA